MDENIWRGKTFVRENHLGIKNLIGPGQSSERTAAYASSLECPGLASGVAGGV